MTLKENIWNNTDLEKTLLNNGVVIMPTDTIYGMVGRSQNEKLVNRIYSIRKRSPEKPCIILIGDINELEKFAIHLSEKQKEDLAKYWSFGGHQDLRPFDKSQDIQPFDESQDLRPCPTSIILDCSDDAFAYLHRGTNTLAFRIPAPRDLRDLLLKVGPLIAPSANQESFPPYDTVEDARNYFGDAVDLYVDGGELKGKPSKLIKLGKNGSVTVLRE